MAATDHGIKVEVACALPSHQEIIALRVPAGTTAREAVALSGIRQRFPGVDMDNAELGIFSRPLDGVVLPLPQDYVLQAHDRVEIYRPLVTDPKQARLARAQQQRQQEAQRRVARNQAGKNKSRGA